MTEEAIESARSLILEKLGLVEGMSFHDLVKLMPSRNGPPETQETNVMAMYVAFRSLLNEGAIKLFPLLRRGDQYLPPARVVGIDPKTDEWVLCLVISVQQDAQAN